MTTKYQRVAGELYLGLMETLTGQHRSEWVDYGVRERANSKKVEVYMLSRSGSIQSSIVVKENGDVTGIKVDTTHEFKVKFLINSLRIAFGVLTNG